MSMIGEKLGSFRVESILGTGAMGIVYRAVHETTGRAAAVKVISGEIAQKGKSYDRFRREAEILQQFRHSGIVRFYAVGRYQGTSYIAMEFVQGATLEQILAERGPLPWREVVDLAIQICDALHYAHQHGVVHRDLKPSNLMVSDRGEVKLTDFGIAKDLDATALTADGRTLGTAAYMAPEQIRGSPPTSHKTDLYALGVVLFQMLTGRTPFGGTTAVVLLHAHLNETPPRASEKTADIPKALDDLVAKLLAKSPNDRPWDAAAVSLTLSGLKEKAAKGESVSMVWPTPGAEVATESTVPRKVKKGAKTRTRSRIPQLDRSVLTTALLVVALIVVGGVIAWGLWPPGEEYLFQHAQALMASNDRHDWMTAISEYVDPLDKRFPNHAHKAETSAWRDKLLLAEAEGRAKTLSSGVRTLLSEPKGKGELQYVAHQPIADEASQKGDDLSAIRQWDDMVKQLDEKDPEERKWVLYARQRVDVLTREIKDRQAVVQTQILRIAEALKAGKTDEAIRIRDEILKKFGHYTGLEELLNPIRPPAASPPAEAAPNGPPPEGEKTSDLKEKSGCNIGARVVKVPCPLA